MNPVLAFLGPGSFNVLLIGIPTYLNENLTFPKPKRAASRRYLNGSWQKDMRFWRLIIFSSEIW
jgi:hypothetical protein